MSPINRTTLRVVKTPINEYFPQYRPEAQRRITDMFLRLKANPDYPKYETLQRVADRGDVRVVMHFPEEMPDHIIMQLADRKSPTRDEFFETIIPNLFRSKKNQKDLRTMTAEEGKQFLINSVKNVFKIKVQRKDPIKTLVFKPEEPFADKFQKAIREIGNERLFGIKK